MRFKKTILFLRQMNYANDSNKASSFPATFRASRNRDSFTTALTIRPAGYREARSSRSCERCNYAAALGVTADWQATAGYRHYVKLLHCKIGVTSSSGRHGRAMTQNRILIKTRISRCGRTNPLHRDRSHRTINLQPFPPRAPSRTYSFSRRDVHR